jgi:hypothetical protein
VDEFFCWLKRNKLSHGLQVGSTNHGVSSNAATDDGLRSTHYPGQSGQLGSEPLIGTAQEFATFIASEGKKWADVRKRFGVNLEWGRVA